VEKIYLHRILSLIKYQYFETEKVKRKYSSRRIVEDTNLPTQVENKVEHFKSQNEANEMKQPQNELANGNDPVSTEKINFKYNTSNKNDLEIFIKNAQKRNKMRNFCFQFFFLTGKSFYLFFKNKIFIIMSTVFLFIMNGIILALYIDLGDIDHDTYTAITNRQGFLFIVAVMAFFTGANSTVLSLLPKKKVYIKDQHSRYYSKLAFYLSEQIVNLPVFGVSYLIVSVIFFYALGLNTFPDISNLFYFYYFLFVGSYLGGSSIGFMIGSMADDMETVSLLIPLFVLPLMLCNGFFGNLKDSNIFIQGFSYISPPKFFFQGLTLTEFQNYQEYIDKCRLPVPCPPSSDQETCYQTGFQIICDPRQTADFFENEIWQNVLGSAILIVSFRILGFFLFWIINRDKKLETKDNLRMRKQIQEFLKMADNIELNVSIKGSERSFKEDQ
jgi:ABC-type multidrug transport system permease subunit